MAPYCTPCGRQFSQIQKTGSVVGFMFRCPGCNQKQQLATGSFMEGAHVVVPLRKLVVINYFWATDMSVGKTIVQCYMYLRDICSWKLLRTPIQLGGTDKVVQIDESVMVKAKYHRRHQVREKQRWVFSMYDPELKSISSAGYSNYAAAALASHRWCVIGCAAVCPCVHYMYGCVQYRSHVDAARVPESNRKPSVPTSYAYVQVTLPCKIK